MEQYVYIIQGEKTGLVKIGIAFDVQGRLAEHQIGSPDILRIVKVFGPTLKASDIEVELHEVFAEQRRHGEWFEPNEHLMAAVKDWYELPVEAIQPRCNNRGTGKTRENGQGGLFKRGRLWWCQFYRDNKQVRLSTKTDDRVKAAAFLQEQMAQ